MAQKLLWTSHTAAATADRCTGADHASRFLLLCEVLDSTREDTAITALEHLFRERGLEQGVQHGTTECTKLYAIPPGDAAGTIVQASQIELVPITAFGDHNAAAFDDGAAINAAVVAWPVSERRLLLLAPP